MAILELHGKCRELGYCDCGGFLGCVDEDGVKPKPDSATLEAAARKHDTIVNEKDISRYAEAMPELTGSMDHRLVDCEVCDKSHQPNHPHIANIDGDVPVDGAAVPETAGPRPIGRAEMPDWLQDSVPRSYATKRNAPKCEVCGLIRRSNHNCKGAPAVPEPQTDERIARTLPKPVPATIYIDESGESSQCPNCLQAGELCVRHGGSWDGFDTPKPERTAPKPAIDPEIAAISAIVEALAGVDDAAKFRILNYIDDRIGRPL